jgi:class 3 adenylate cyclase
MKNIPFGQLRFAVLFFLIFFLISAAGQYLFVRAQVENIIVRGSREDAQSINKAVGFDNGVNLKEYNKAWIDAGDYVVVLNDGTILDVAISNKSVVPPGLLPPVECPVLSDSVFRKPTLVSYTGGAKQPEKWKLFGKRLDKGYWMFGYSEYDEIDNPDKRLEDMVALLGSTLESAEHARVDQFANDVSWILVDDRGVLIEAVGRIPLKTDAVEIGRMSKEPAIRVLGNKTYYVSYSSITDREGNQVGIVVLPAEMKETATALSNLVDFNIAVAILSFIVFILLAFFYSRNNEKEKQEIREAFQHYFSPQILEAILREPERLKLGGQRREVTVLFSDIRSFTSVAEKLAPQQLTRLMQEYFTEMTEAVFATDGIVDKFIGDALMAFWGAPIEQPDQADRAVKTAIDMTARLQRLQQKWAAEALPLLDIGIGINLGIATIGNFGSANRFDYTIIGDTVNAASRLEALNKEYNSHVIISESTKEQVTFPIHTLDLGEVAIKGKEKPMHVFEVLAR